MALLNILHYPNPLLRKKCNKVTEITNDIIRLADNMCETLAYHKGLGLAGNQVGYLKRIIVMDNSYEDSENFIQNLNSFLIVDQEYIKVSDLNFKFAFGQHSGVIDSTKNFLELPRFPINEKYGELKRFKTILQTLPFPYKSITPENRYLKKDNNPPVINIKFFENLINIKNINCYSNEGNIWKKSDISFINNNEIIISFKEKFKSERGRINCSLWEEGGKWRWLGIQYVVAEY